MTNIRPTERIVLRVEHGTKAKLRSYALRHKIKDLSKIVRKAIEDMLVKDTANAPPTAQ
jgi:hypothetical protein